METHLKLLIFSLIALLFMGCSTVAEDMAKACALNHGEWRYTFDKDEGAAYSCLPKQSLTQEQR